LSAMCTIWSSYTCYPNTNVISRIGHKMYVLDSTDKCFIFIHIRILFRNEVYYLYPGSQIILFSSLDHRACFAAVNKA